MAAMDMEYVVETESFNVVISSNDTHLEMEFGDGYQQDLVAHYHWSEEQVTSVDKVLEKELEKKGFDCRVYWEDKELFIIELSTRETGLDAKLMAEIIHSLIPDSTIKEDVKLRKLNQSS